MTFAIFENQSSTARKMIGTLWATDEADAKAIAPAVLGRSNADHYSIVRTEDREIPLKISEAFRCAGF